MALNLIQGKRARAQKVVLYGPEGIGKSTFATAFPNPLFIDVEQGTSQLDVVRTERPTSWAMLKQILGEFNADPMGFQTLVIDTADALETLCIEHVCAEHGKSGVEDFGYGKGYTFVSEAWGKFLNFLTDLTERGVNVVLLAHAHMRKIEQPDETGAYDHWELKLSKRSAPLTKEWADMLLFANYEIMVIDIDGKKKAQGGNRVVHTSHHPCWDAKNRHGLADKLKLDFAEIASCIPAGTVGAPPTSASVIEEQLPMSDTQIPNPAPVAEPEPTGTKVPITNPAGFPTKLWDLMQRDGVTELEIQQATALRNYYPVDTPVGNYADEYVEFLVSKWEQVKELINNQVRKEAA